MITYYIGRFFIWLLSFVTSPLLLLPTAVLPAGIASALTQAGNTLAIFDIFVPVGTLLAVFGSMTIVEAGYFSYKGIRWIYNKIPGIN